MGSREFFFQTRWGSSSWKFVHPNSKVRGLWHADMQECYPCMPYTQGCFLPASLVYDIVYQMLWYVLTNVQPAKWDVKSESELQVIYHINKLTFCKLTIHTDLHFTHWVIFSHRTTAKYKVSAIKHPRPKPGMPLFVVMGTSLVVNLYPPHLRLVHQLLTSGVWHVSLLVCLQETNYSHKMMLNLEDVHSARLVEASSGCLLRFINPNLSDSVNFVPFGMMRYSTVDINLMSITLYNLYICISVCF